LLQDTIADCRPKAQDHLVVRRRRHIREVLDALEWARIERMRVGSPDFVRARVIEQSVQRLCERMAKGNCKTKPKAGDAEEA
jgi:hypothetical protein